MTKIFKNSKQICSVVIALAVVAISLFTGAAAINVSAAVSETVYWDGTTKTEPTEQDGETYIINTAAELAWLATQSSSYAARTGSYKVADGIKNIVLQPESLSGVMDLTTTKEVKNFFTDNAATAVKWEPKEATQFGGTLDLNGATIYGMYVNDTSGSVAGGLFAYAHHGAVIKNVSFENCYINTTAKTGFVTAYILGGENRVEIKNVSIKNNYVKTTQGNSGSLIGQLGTVPFDIENVIICDNEFDFNGSSSLPLFRNKPTAGSTIKNVITVDVKTEYPGGLVGAVTYTDVYATVFDNEVGNADLGVKKITAEQIVGSAAETAIPELDWTDTWFATAGTPELRTLHNIEAVLYKGDTTHHYYKCSDCDLTSEKIAHDYDADFYCATCERKCLHQAADGMTATPSTGDCVTKAGKYTACPCGYSEYIPTADAVDPSGHKFTTHNEADCGDCLTDGKAEHWICEVCGKTFVTNATFAPMGDALTDPDNQLNTGVGPHNPEVDPDTQDKIIMNDKNGHWYECTVCDGRLDLSINKLEQDEVEAHSYTDGVCDDCDYACPHNFELTGKIAVVGDCDTAEESELKCSICSLRGRTVTREAGHYIEKVAQVDPTEELEGTKEHYQCKLCKAVFADAKGTTVAKTADLVIAKLAPENLDALMAEIEKNSIPPVVEEETEDDADDETEDSVVDNTVNNQEDFTNNSSQDDETVDNTSPSKDETASDDETVVIKKTTNVTLESQGKVFADSVEVKVERINDVSVLENIKTSIKDQAKKFAAYEITAQSAGTTVQPNGTVIATFNIPSGYNLDRVAVLYLDEAGKTEKLKSTVDKENNTVKVEIDHFSKYIVVETKAETTQTDAAQQSSNAWIWIVVAVVAVLLIAGAVVFFFVYKKKKA